MSTPVTVVVLAGGSSRRFGADKLRQPLGRQTLLDAAVAGLPVDAALLVVGEQRPGDRAARHVREDPPGGGPAAAVVAGLRALPADFSGLVAVMPGDAPAAGRAATRLLEVLAARPGLSAVVAVDGEGREQPLQLALRPAAVARLSARHDSAGRSARWLLGLLDPPATRVTLGDDLLFDIDTPAQLAAWTAQDSPAVTALLELAVSRRRADGRPVVLALDGRSGSGKSTLATAIRLRTGATVLPGDDFYSPTFAGTEPVELARLSPRELAARVFDWSRLRTEALEPLAAGRPARYRAFDWGSGDGSGAPGPEHLGRARVLPSAPVVVLEGVYAARPELADLVTASALVTADDRTRQSRLAARGDDPGWAEQWRRAEDWYFDAVLTPAQADLVVPGTPHPGAVG